MTQQFTASEVRNAIPCKETRNSAMLRAFADLLEAQEKAVPVMVVDHVSSAEHDLPIGMKLYTHPAPADAERLAEALQPFANLFQALYATMPDDRPIYGINKAEITAGDLRRANEALAAHSAHSDTERLADQHDDAFQQAVQEARRVWMDEFPCEAGHDQVTPFDQFLYGNRPCMEAQPPAASVPKELIEWACRAWCADQGWDADAPVTYAGTRKQVCNRDGNVVKQWEMHIPEATVMLQATVLHAQQENPNG